MLKRVGIPSGAAVLFAILPITVFAAAHVFFGAFAQGGMSFPPVEWVSVDPGAAADELTARYQLLSLAFLYVVVGSVSVSRVIWDVVVVFERRTILTLLLIAIAGSAVVVTTYLYAPSGGQLGKNDIDLAVQAYLTSRSSVKDLWNYQAYINFGICYTYFLAVASSFLMIGLISCISPRARINRELFDRSSGGRFEAYVYLITATLVIGLIFFREWTLYPSFVVPDDFADVRRSYRAAVDASYLVQGLIFTVSLVAIAAPISWRLDRLAGGATLGSDNNRKGSSQTAKGEAGRPVSKRLIRTFVASLLPLATGAGPMLIEAFQAT